MYQVLYNSRTKVLSFQRKLKTVVLNNITFMLNVMCFVSFDFTILVY